MTTLTTRPLPLIPLAIPSPIRTSNTIEPLCNDRSSVTSSLGSPLTTSPIATPTNSLIVTKNHIIIGEEMHPDNLLLQGHGVTSPRLSSTNSTNSNSNMDNRDHPLGIYNNNNNNNNNNNSNNLNKIPNNNCDLLSSTNVRPILGTFLSVDSQKSIDNHRNSSSENDSEMSYHQHKSSLDNINKFNQKLNNNNIIDDVDDDDLDETIDRMSCCSEDSELSVGQEGGCDNNNIKNNISEQNNNYNNNINNSNKKIINNINNRKFLLENSDFLNDKLINTKQQQQQQQQIMMLDDSESVDNMSSVSDIDNRGIASVSVISENLPSNDDLSNDSNHNNRDHNLVDPTIMMATAAAAAVAVNGLRIPVPIVRPSPTRIQEEFLRKSHLYAEELMKQQMQFMAAARASAFSLRHNVSGVLNSQDIGKVGFRPHIKQQNSGISPSNIQQQQQQQTNSLNENLTNFSGIHSHLNAISKISSQLGVGNSNESALSKFTAFGMASVREQSQSPPPQQQQQLNNHQNNHLHHMHQLHPHLPFLNNNFHEPSLKFSIDNILKADFGRRITDPLLKRSGGLNNRKHSSKLERQQQKNQTAIDLTNLISHTNNTLHQISSGLSSVSSNCSSDSNSTINALDKNQRVTPVKSPSITSPSTVPNVTSTSSSAQSPNSTITATGAGSSSTTTSSDSSNSNNGGPMVWPAWVYCTRYSDRPSSGPRTKKPKKPPSEKGSTSSTDDKRPRTAFSGPQLARLKHEFAENRYLTEKRRQQLSAELGLNEAQIKIWFQNKRAKIKKSSGSKNPLALQLMAQGLYNHSTVPLTREEEELQELQAQNASA